MEIGRIKNARRDRRQDDEDDPGNVFRIVDPHGSKPQIPNPKSQGNPKPKIGKSQTAPLSACRLWELGFGN
jgi:hypothetical protein